VYDQPTNLGACAAVGESRGKLHEATEARWKQNRRERWRQNCLQVEESASAAVMTTKAAQRRKKWHIPDHTGATIALQRELHAGRR